MKSKRRFKMAYNTATQRKTLIDLIYPLRWMNGWMRDKKGWREKRGGRKA